MYIYPVCTFDFVVSFLSKEAIDQRRFPHPIVANKHASDEVIDVGTILQRLLIQRHSLKSKAAYFLWCLFVPL